MIYFCRIYLNFERHVLSKISFIISKLSHSAAHAFAMSCLIGFKPPRSCIKGERITQQRFVIASVYLYIAFKVDEAHIVGVETALQKSFVRLYVADILFAETETETLQPFHFYRVVLTEQSQILFVIDLTSDFTLNTEI